MTKIIVLVVNIGLFCMLSTAMGYLLAVALTGA